MGKLFDLNNPIWQTVGKLVDVFVLHLVWVICCIPIVTIGPATIAFYYSMMKDVKDEESHYVKAFFRSFKQNLRQGIPMGLLLVAMGVLLGYSLLFYIRQGNADSGNSLWTVLKIMSIFFGILYLFIMQYAFPLMARFDNTVMRTIKNAFLLSIRNFLWTLVMIAVSAAPYVIVYYTNFVPLLLLGYGLVVFVNSYILNRIFEPFIKEQMPDEEEEDPDHWEIEEELPGEEEPVHVVMTADSIPSIQANDPATPADDQQEKENI